MLLKQSKDGPHTFGLFLVHHQPSAARVHVVAQHRAPAHPFSLPPRRRHLVARTLADQLPFELSKAKKNVQRQSSQRGAGVELLGDRNETHLVLLEDTQHAGEVQQRSAQTVALYTTTQSSSPASIAWNSLPRAGRSMFAPVKPPSAYSSGNAIQPSRR